MRIAMWSGPRNISTALLRSWGNRPDTLVNDEPLYGAFLSETGYGHPVAAEIIDHYETDWSKVVAGLPGEIPGGKSIYYQKHMAHHLLPGMGREWVLELDNCFLLREPREMLTSLIKILPEPGVADTGLPQQLEIFRMVEAQLEKTPRCLTPGMSWRHLRGSSGFFVRSSGLSSTPRCSPGRLEEGIPMESGPLTGMERLKNPPPSGPIRPRMRKFPGSSGMCCGNVWRSTRCSMSIA